MEKVNVALIGFGPGGRVYNAPVIASVEGLVIKTILTSNSINIKAAQQDFPNAVVVQDFDSILSDPEIDLVIILLPNHLHFKFAKKALEAGKHVVVEKPFTPTTKEADELISLARQKDLVLSVNHNRRWDSDVRTAKKLIEERKLGEIVEYETHFDRFRPQVKEGWKENKQNPGSGIVYDLGSHLIDQALMLFGNPESVYADIRIQRKQAEVADNFEILLFYPNLKVTLKAGILVNGKIPKIAIFGTHGSYIKYGADVQEEALKQGKRPQDDEQWGLEPDTIWGHLTTLDEDTQFPSEKGDYRELYQNIYNAISGKEELKVTPQQARDVIKVIELAYESSERRCEIPFS